jgi:exonuclease III
VKLVTWNVDSPNMRLPGVREFLGQHTPDVVCMRETESEPAAFPVDELAQAGYHAVHHSAGRWAGVTIVARSDLELTDRVAGPPGELRDDEARWIEAAVGGLRVVSVYVPNGARTACRRSSAATSTSRRPTSTSTTPRPSPGRPTCYRQGHFHRGMGLRIDLLLASEALARSFVACGIARDYRKGTKPSDHAPLLLELGAS